jgi:hypothetical protein
MSQQLISISFQSTYLVLPWCCCLCYLLSCCGCLCSAACAAVPLLPLLCCLCCLCSAFSAAATWFAPRAPPTSSRAAPPRWPVACRTAARPPGAPRHEGPHAPHVLDLRGGASDGCGSGSLRSARRSYESRGSGGWDELTAHKRTAGLRSGVRYTKSFLSQ